MKKSIVALITILLFYSCWGPEQGGCTLYTYTIKNESGKNITIKANRIGFPNNPPVITNIPLGEKLTKTFKSCPPSSSYEFSDFFGDKNTRIIDTITVIYENRKFGSFRKDCTARNPLNFCNINPEVTFVFTAQDYEDAQDCNGSCD
jgi:hypothetical protein